MSQIIKFRLILWLILLATVLLLLYRAIVPGGQINYSYEIDKPNIFISQLKPTERTALPQDNQQAVIGDPVYFDLYLPRRFDQAEVSLWFKNQANIPVIELGLLKNQAAWQFDFVPLLNKHLDQCLSTWLTISQDNTWLCQRQPTYGSLEAFQKKLPVASELAVYNYNLTKNIRLANYRASAKTNLWSQPLQGAHQFYTYLDAEVLNFIFTIVDLNKQADPDPVTVNVYSAKNELVMTKQLPDDGNTTTDGQTVAFRQINVVQAQLPAGLYKIVIEANQDLVIDSIATSLQYLSFINHLQLAPGKPTALQLYTDSPIVRAQTEQAQGLQTLTVAGKELQLLSSYQQYSLDNLVGVSEIKLANGGLLLSGKGVFGQTANQLLNPNYLQADSYFSLTDQTNYILANYQPPISEDGWQKATATFDLSAAKLIEGKYRFVLSAPGLLAEDQINDQILIKKIAVQVSGKTLWQKIQEILQSKLD